MKTVVFALAAFCATVAFAPVSVSAQATDKMNPGDQLPSMDVKMKNADGAPTSFKDAKKENGLLVMFSCNTCPFVVKNQPITEKVIAYARAHNIGMVIINSNEAQRDNADSYNGMVSYARTQRYTVPYLVDEGSKMADIFGASHTPEVYLFNKQDKLVYKGAMNDNPGDPSAYKKMYVEDAINAMIAGTPIDPQTTKSIGCGIKRKA